MARYFLRYRHTDTGLTPTFNFFKKASDLTSQTAPPIGEVGAGTYYFDYSPAFDIIFEADGGASITDVTIRYISDTIGPKDIYVDEPSSQIKNDVWDDTTVRSAGTKGDFVKHIGVQGDAVDASTVFGKLYKVRDVIMGGTGFGGTGVDVKTAKESIKGADDRSLTDVAGSSFAGGTDSLRILSDVLDAIMGTGFATGTDSLKVVSDSIDNAVISIKGAGPTDITQVKTVVDAVKLKTDNLPSDPASQATTNTNISAVTSSVKGSDNRDLTQIAGTGFDTSADSLKVTSDGMKRALGMLHENSVLDSTTFTVDNNLQTGRLRIYDSKANADAALAAAIAALPGISIYDTGKIAEYAIAASYIGTNLKTYGVSREA